MEHVVKLHPVAFAAVASGQKSHVILKSNRKIQEADLLYFLEVSPATEKPTGTEIYGSVLTVQKIDKGNSRIEIELIPDSLMSSAPEKEK